MRQYIFDSPQWQWSRAYSPGIFCGIDNTVEVLGVDDDRGSLLWVNIPAEFLRYLRELHDRSDLYYCYIKLQKLKSGGYDFTYTYNGTEYFLWHYKTLPPAFQE